VFNLSKIKNQKSKIKNQKSKIKKLLFFYELDPAGYKKNKIQISLNILLHPSSTIDDFSDTIF
jgi:hypothetical protein